MIQVCRVWNLSIASILILTISNVLITVRLLHNVNCPLSGIGIVGNQFNVDTVNSISKNGNDAQSKSIKTVQLSQTESSNAVSYQPCIEYIISDSTSNISDPPVFSTINLSLGRWDSRRLYKYFDNALVGEKFTDLSDEYKVCLATQSSLEKLFSLVQVANHWNGPISAAIYIAGNDELYLLQLYISYLRKCYPAIRDAITFHLAYPKAYSPTILRRWFDVDFSQFNCGQPEQTLIALLKYRTIETIKWRTKNAYPQNHLRNLARKGCQSDYVFLTDVDIIPSINFAEHLDKFLRNEHCQKLCAYVIPTYELDIRVKFPKDKLDLIRLSKKGLARPFHQKVFIYNQFATNFSRWESDTYNKEAHISYNVTNFEFLYEPFYVSTDLVPPHDERFIGYGFTRNTQVYEMFVAGYQFQVLSPIFTCHWGLQNRKGRPAWRERQNNINRKQFEVFKREVFARYHKDPLKMLQQPKRNGPIGGNKGIDDVGVRGNVERKNVLGGDIANGGFVGAKLEK